MRYRGESMRYRRESMRYRWEYKIQRGSIRYREKKYEKAERSRETDAIFLESFTDRTSQDLP